MSRLLHSDLSRQQSSSIGALVWLISRASSIQPGDPECPADSANFNQSSIARLSLVSVFPVLLAPSCSLQLCFLFDGFLTSLLGTVRDSFRGQPPMRLCLFVAASFSLNESAAELIAVQHGGKMQGTRRQWTCSSKHSQRFISNFLQSLLRVC